jgi:hypothetical protein
MRFQVLTAASTKIRAFWDVAPWKYTDVSEMLITSIIRTSETSVYYKVHGTLSQKALIFKKMAICGVMLKC